MDKNFLDEFDDSVQHLKKRKVSASLLETSALSEEALDEIWDYFWGLPVSMWYSLSFGYSLLSSVEIKEVSSAYQGNAGMLMNLYNGIDKEMDSIKVVRDKVVVSSKKHTISFRVNNYNDPQTAQSLFIKEEDKRKFENMLRGILPTFKLKPGTYESTIDTFKNMDNEYFELDPSSSESDWFTNKFTTEEDYEGIEELPLGANLHLSLTVQDPVESFRGTQFPVSVEFYADFSLPLDFAFYATGVESKANFKLGVFLMWCRHYTKWSTGTTNNNREPGVFKPLSTTVAALSEAMNKVPSFKPRVSEQGFCVLRNGRVMYIPKDQGNVGLYEQALDSLIDPQTGQIDFSGLNELSGKHVFTDWVNDNAIMVSNGDLNSIDLTGAVPLDPSIEHEWYMQEIPRLMGNTKDTFDSRFNKADPDLLEVDFDVVPGAMEVYGVSDYKELKNRLADIPTSTMLNNLSYRGFGIFGGAPTPADIHAVGLAETDVEPRDIPVLQQAVCLAARLKEFWRNRDKYLEGWTDYYKMYSTFQLYIICSGNATRMATCKAAHTERTRTNNQIVPFDPEATIAIPNVEVREGKFESLLRHQAEAYGRFDLDPKTSLLQVAPGGGKTIMLLTKILRQLKKQNTRRPMILTKPGLVAEFATEINTVTNGKVNVFPFRPNNLVALIDKMGFETDDELISYVNSLPRNTIFLASYSDFSDTRVFFDEDDLQAGYAWYYEPDYPYSRIVAACGFDQIECDESHSVKNPDSQRTVGVTRAMSRSSTGTLASGTTVANTVNDLVGQMQTRDPSVFGSLAQFEENFGISSGIIKDAESADAINTRLKFGAQVVSKSPSDWAYLMPNRKERLHYVRMSEGLTKIYEGLLKTALLEAKSRLKGMDLDDEENEAQVMAVLRASLAGVEQFLVDPASSEAVQSAMEKGIITEEEVISPKIQKIDQLIDEHLATARSDEKVAVFGYHLVGPAHVMKYSRHKSIMLHYTAGRRDVVDKFRTDPKYKVLVAAENSLKEGYNLQVISRLIRMQSVWTSGELNQAVARMYRPDPRMVYMREEVTQEWVLTQTSAGAPTLDLVKTARLISKVLSNFRVSYGEDKDWSNYLNTVESLPLLSMNLDSIAAANESDLIPYLNEWSQLIDFENKINDSRRLQLANELSGKGIRDVFNKDGSINKSVLIKNSMVEIEEDSPIEGSARVYTPWVPGAKPADPHGLDLALAGEEHEVRVGDFVMTEYGAGEIKTVRAKSVVVILSDGQTVSLPKDAVAVSTTRKGFHKLKAGAESGEYDLTPTARGKKIGKGGKTKPSKRPSVLEPDEKILDEEEPENKVVEVDEEESPFLDIKAAVLNGMPAFLFKDEDGDIPAELENAGWTVVPRFFELNLVNARQSEKFLEKLKDKFAINSEHYDRLLATIIQMKSGQRMVAHKLPTSSVLMDFWRYQRRKLGVSKKSGKPFIRPYWMVTDDRVRLVFDLKTHDPKVLRSVKQMAVKNPGIKSGKVVKGMVVNFYRNVTEAHSDMRSLLKQGAIQVDRKQVADQLKKAQATLRKIKAARKS